MFLFDCAVVGPWAWVFEVLIVEPFGLHGEGSLTNRGQGLLGLQSQRRRVWHPEKGLVCRRREGELRHP